jgi:hypothetical protein
MMMTTMWGLSYYAFIVESSASLKKLVSKRKAPLDDVEIVILKAARLL